MSRMSDEEWSSFWHGVDHPGINWAAVCGWVCVLLFLYVLFGGHF